MKKIKTTIKLLLAIIAVMVAIVSCKKDSYAPVTDNPLPEPTTQATFIKASGDISAALASFRHLLGDSLNTKPDANPLGRREINWDAVPANFTNTGNFPLDFFNNTDSAAGAGRKRGFVLSDNGAAFRVDSTNFSQIDLSYDGQFQAFSPKRTFASVGNNITFGAFRVPGAGQMATVKGFGVIFSDVDDENSTSIEYFSNEKSLGVFRAPRRSGGTAFSFVGVFFPNDQVTHVKITAGNGLLAPGAKDLSDGGIKDLVVMDDFLYTEPKGSKVAL